ncbi:MAG: hypothetical protein ACHQ9S_19060 [Candidatus Binatia bacterium]
MRTQRALTQRPLTHAERDAYCHDNFWCEPGARNARQEFIRWLHFRNDTHAERFVVPWPFERGVIEPDVLLAHWHMHRFQNWPGEWFNFSWNLDYLHLSAMIGKRVLTWGLGRSPIYLNATQFPESVIPKEFINALTGSDKAGR